MVFRLAIIWPAEEARRIIKPPATRPRSSKTNRRRSAMNGPHQCKPAGGPVARGNHLLIGETHRRSHPIVITTLEGVRQEAD